MYAFEELIGSHGGVGGWQSLPFVMHPKELIFPNYKVVGAENLHKILKNWLKGNILFPDIKKD